MMSLSHIIVIAALLTIIFCLFSGLYFLVSTRGKTNSTVKALTWRISLSVLLFIGLWVGFAMGWLTPHSLIPVATN